MEETKELTNALLKEKMVDAMVFRGVSSSGCLEDFVKTGIYGLKGSGWTTAYTPPCASYWISVLEVIERGTGDVIQRLTQIDTGDIYVRTYRLGEWKPWMKIQMVQVN